MLELSILKNTRGSQQEQREYSYSSAVDSHKDDDGEGLTEIYFPGKKFGFSLNPTTARAGAAGESTTK